MSRFHTFGMYVAALLLGPTLALCASAGAEGELRSRFDTCYRQWLSVVSNPDKWPNPNSSIDPGWKELHAIVALGPGAVPLLVDKLQSARQDNSAPAIELRGIVRAMSMTTWKRFPTPAWPKGKFAHHDAEADLYIQWWHEGRKRTPQEFAELYAKWQVHRKEGKQKEADAVLGQIKDLGIDVLPLVIAKIEQGEDALIPLVSRICRKKVAGDKPTRKDILNWWKNEKDQWTLPPYEEPKSKR